MYAMSQAGPWLPAMALLLGFSAFFSASEAALFYLRWKDRKEMEAGSRRQRMAVALLSDSDRLLSAILFCNLLTNVTYFAISSIVVLRFEEHPQAGSSAAILFASGSLVTLIFLGEMLPKCVAVVSPRWISTQISLPLTLIIRLVDPVMPLFRFLSLLSQRLLSPHFAAESYLAADDLQRAVELVRDHSQLGVQECAALRSIILLSDVRVDEWMRPRNQFLAFRPPVTLADLGGRVTASGYLFVTEADSPEVAAALNLRQLTVVPVSHFERLATPVLIVPWCMTVADALQQMHSRDREVAAVVNEFGETIGILTIEDILDTVFAPHATRSDRLLHRPAIQQVGEGQWQVTGMTSLRRLARYFALELPPSKSTTVTGIVQELLQRLAEPGDRCTWGPFQLHVLEAPARGQLLVELTRHGSTQETTW